LGANVLGKEKPKEVDKTIPSGPEVQKVTTTPLADIIELVTVMYGGSAPGEANTGKYDPASGKGDRSHVIVRYKGQLTPAERGLRGTQPVASAGPGAPAGRADSVAASATAGGRRGGPGQRGGAGGPKPVTPMPNANASSAGAEILQRVWVAGDG